ncbi:MAG: PilZ domain-containing protein [Proteobacteria bacterium]|nr:PilZ domain-containing protein [Pseudomonadota bacterium]MBU1709030.1 PilZ domain-containing protein [Pseudomonadota bacterium]
MKETHKLTKSCPHWIKENGLKECNISKGGLYIPMPDHIQTYCLSLQYDRCNHYIREYELLQDRMMLETSEASDRRLYRRIDGSYSLFLSPFEGMGLQKEIVEKEAKTIDISLGGMQIQSYDRIPTQQMMAFKFGSDFTMDSITGIGEVRWCTDAQKDEGFLAGIAFTFLNEDMKIVLRNRISSSLM